MKVVSISIHNHTRAGAEPVTLTVAQDLTSFGFFQRGSVREKVRARSAAAATDGACQTRRSAKLVIPAFGVSAVAVPDMLGSISTVAF